MDARQRSNLAAGLVLILLGAWLLAARIFPALAIRFDWPWFVIGAGILMLVIGLLTGVPGMAVPAAIVGGIGGLLYWQNATGHWESWAYVWTLIPGFVGVGAVLAALIGGEGRQSVYGGLKLMLLSVILFAVFGSFFGALGFLGNYWPVLLILLGLILLVRPLFRPKQG